MQAEKRQKQAGMKEDRKRTQLNHKDSFADVESCESFRCLGIAASVTQKRKFHRIRWVPVLHSENHTSKGMAAEISDNLADISG